MKGISCFYTLDFLLIHKISFNLMLLCKAALRPSRRCRLFECHGERCAGMGIVINAHIWGDAWPDSCVPPPPCSIVVTISLPRASASSRPAPTPIRGNVIFQHNELQGLIMQSWRCTDLSAAPRRCANSRPISHVRPTEGSWRCCPSHGGNIWAFLPYWQGNCRRKTSSLTSVGHHAMRFVLSEE